MNRQGEQRSNESDGEGQETEEGAVGRVVPSVIAATNAADVAVLDRAAVPAAVGSRTGSATSLLTGGQPSGKEDGDDDDGSTGRDEQGGGSRTTTDTQPGYPRFHSSSAGVSGHRGQSSELDLQTRLGFYGTNGGGDDGELQGRISAEEAQRRQADRALGMSKLLSGGREPDSEFGLTSLKNYLSMASEHPRDFLGRYLNYIQQYKPDPKTSSLDQAQSIARALLATLTYATALLVLCPGLPEMVLGPMFPVLAPIIGLFAQYILFPLIIAFEIWRAVSAIVHFVKADNKNLEKTAELCLALGTALAVSVAGALFMSGAASPVIVTGLLLGSVGLNTLYHILQFFHHGYLLLKEPSSNKAWESFFWGKVLDHFWSAMTGLVLTGGLMLCFLLPALGITLLPPVVLFVVMGVAAAVLLGGMVHHCYRQKHPLHRPGPSFAEILGDSYPFYPLEERSSISAPKTRTGYYARGDELGSESSPPSQSGVRGGEDDAETSRALTALQACNQRLRDRCATHFFDSHPRRIYGVDPSSSPSDQRTAGKYCFIVQADSLWVTDGSSLSQYNLSGSERQCFFRDRSPVGLLFDDIDIHNKAMSRAASQVSSSRLCEGSGMFSNTMMAEQSRPQMPPQDDEAALFQDDVMEQQPAVATVSP